MTPVGPTIDLRRSAQVTANGPELDIFKSGVGDQIRVKICRLQAAGENNPPATRLAANFLRQFVTFIGMLREICA